MKQKEFLNSAKKKGVFMWPLVKSELKYYRIAFTAPIFYTILFQISEFYISKKALSMNKDLAQTENADTWAVFYSFVILFSIFSIWQTRLKEKRDRFFSMLPLSYRQLAFSRFWFAIIPITILLLYFIAIHIMVIHFWNIKLNIPLIELGIILILFAGFIRARDDWFSHWNFGKRVQATFVSVLIIQIIVVAIFLNPPAAYRKSIPIIADYTEIIFFLLGLVIMVTTMFSYQKRKSHLS